jgi:replication factor C small subunit
MESYSSIIWVDKYSPKNINDLILSDDYFKIFKSYIEKREIPQLCFWGKPGSGKTTLGTILVSKDGVLNFPKDNLLMINGSSQKTRGIGFVSDIVEPFLSSVPRGDDKIRIIFIDEFDNMTSDSYDALRGIIEKYKKYSRFLVTCNNIYKLPSPVQSRFQIFKFDQMSLEFVIRHCQSILKSENINYELGDVKLIVDRFYPDIRRIINTIQQNVIENCLKINSSSILNNEKKIIENILQIIKLASAKSFNNINKIINDTIELLNGEDLYFTEIYTTLFYMKDMPVPIKIIINRYTNAHNSALVPSMHFMAMIFEIIKFLGGK